MATWSSPRGGSSRFAGFVVLVVLVVLAATFASCGGSGADEREPERVAVRWLRVMARSDVKAACQLMDAENHSRYPEYPNWSSAKDCRERWLHVDNTPVEWKPKPGVLGGWGDSHPKVLGVSVDGDKATVVVEGIGQGRPVWLVKEHGRWLVHEVEYSI